MDYNTTKYNSTVPGVGPKTFPCEGYWNVILRHEDASFSFNRNWTEYRNGFGSADGDIYIGNQVLSFFTLRILIRIIEKMSKELLKNIQFCYIIMLIIMNIIHYQL